MSVSKTLIFLISETKSPFVKTLRSVPDSADLDSVCFQTEPILTQIY